MPQGPGIGWDQGADTARRAVAKAAAGHDLDGIGAHVVDIGQDFLAGTLAQGHHRHHRGNSDNDAQHGQQGAQFVSDHGAHGHAGGFAKPSDLCAPSRFSLRNGGQRLLRGGRRRGGGAAVGHDAAVADLNDALSVGCDLGIVRDQDDGVPVGVQLFQDRHHLGAAGLIQRTGGFVCQDHVAAIHQRARDRYTLLLPARKLPRPVAQAFAQTQPLQQVFGTGMPLHDRHTAINGRNFRVAHGAQVAHQMVALEDEAEMLAAQPRQLVWHHLAGFLAGHLVAAACGPIEAAQNVHQRGFA